MSRIRPPPCRPIGQDPYFRWVQNIGVQEMSTEELRRHLHAPSPSVTRAIIGRGHGRHMDSGSIDGALSFPSSCAGGGADWIGGSDDRATGHAHYDAGLLHRTTGAASAPFSACTAGATSATSTTSPSGSYHGMFRSIQPCQLGFDVSKNHHM